MIRVSTGRYGGVDLNEPKSGGVREKFGEISRSEDGVGVDEPGGQVERNSHQVRSFDWMSVKLGKC